jgi:negative regulator of flagellin synthesis FlgM
MQISSDEINRLLALSSQPRTSVRGSGSAATTGEPVAGGGAAAEVEVSPMSQDVQFVQKVLNRMPDVREDRVSALKAAIENGTYKVSGEDIADLIIRRALADNATL